MSALKQNPENYGLHLKNFSFSQGEEHTTIISVGDDYTLKVFDLENKEVTQTFDAEDEISAVLFIKEKQCIVYGINNELKLLDFSPITSTLEDSVYLCGFNTNVKQILYQNGLIYAISEEEEIYIINFEGFGYGLNKVNSGHKGSIKNIYVNEKFLITIGYDGFLMVNTIKENSFYLKGKIKIAEPTKMNSLSNFTIEIFKNEILFVSGELFLRKISLNVDDLTSLKMESEMKINHPEEILFLKNIDRYLFSLDKSGLLKISFIESFENLIEFSSANLTEKNFEFNKFELLKNEKFSLKNLNFCVGGISGNISFGSFSDLEKLWEKFTNRNEEKNLKENNLPSDFEENKNKENLSINEIKNKLKKKKKKEEDFIDDIAEEDIDEEMSIIKEDEEIEESEKENLESENKESKSEEKEILGLSDIEDEDGEFKSPEEIEKSKFIFINFR